MPTFTGSDRLFLALDHEIRAAGLRGNFTDVVFEMDELPDPARLEARVNALVDRFPIMRARLKRTWRNFEWVTTADSRPSFHFHPYDPATPAGKDSECPWNIIVATHSAVDDINPVEFHLIELEHGSQFVLHSYHPILDGGGVQHVFHTLFHDEEWDSAAQAEADSQPCASTIVRSFSYRARVAALVKAALFFMRGPKSGLPPVKRQACSGTLASKRMYYDAEETRRMMKSAQTLTAGTAAREQPKRRTGRFAYFMGSTMRALHQSGMDEPDEGFNIGYMTSLRSGRDRHPIFGNQVSFLWTGADNQTVLDRQKLIASLGDDHANAMAAGMDQTIVAALDWARFMPLRVLGRIIRKGLGRADRHSFWFGFVGGFDTDVTAIEGVPIRQTFAIVPPAAPPSVVITYAMSHGCMSVSVTYIPDHIDAEWIDAMTERLDQELRMADVEAEVI